MGFNNSFKNKVTYKLLACKLYIYIHIYIYIYIYIGILILKKKNILFVGFRIHWLYFLHFGKFTPTKKGVSYEWY